MKAVLTAATGLMSLMLLHAEPEADVSLAKRDVVELEFETAAGIGYQAYAKKGQGDWKPLGQAIVGNGEPATLTHPGGDTGVEFRVETFDLSKPLAKPATLDTNRVVVLPFKTIGTSGETADLGYGLVSTLTSKLQPLQNLVVIAKESARKFEDTKLSPKEIGQALGAGTIVTGEIQTSSDKVQVNIQLVNANTEAVSYTHLTLPTKA